MRAVFCSLILSCIATYGLSQVSIKGRVTDWKQNLPFATVMLLDSDSVLVKGAVTNDKGEFIFENIEIGHYLISSSMIGYTKIYSDHIPVVDKSIILRDIILEESTTALGEVIVKGEKQLFDQKIDRLVLNIESSITFSGNTILEVLQKSPGVVVSRQNNSISINGKSGVRIMINEKIMQVPLDVAVQMLDGMNASNVEKIELITTPPAKYDSEGNAGIIHIVTKFNEDLGASGSFGLTVGYRWAETFGGNFSLHHRSKNVAWFIDYSVARNHNLHLMKMERSLLDNEFMQTVTDDSHRENITTQQNLNAGMEWRLRKNTLLNIGFTGYSRDWKLNARTMDINQVAIDSTVITKMDISEKNVWQSAGVSIGLQRNINTKSDLRFNLDYLYYHNDNPSNYANETYFVQRDRMEASKIDLQKTTPIYFLIASGEYHYQVSPSFNLETGIKAVTSVLTNNILVQRPINDAWTVDPVFTSYSNLEEQVRAVFISTNWKAENQLQINSGLRYEYTHTSISTPAQEDFIDRKYGYLFPNISLKKILLEEKDIQFSYSRRINRPTFNDIAPYIFFWGPNTFSAGNTALYPAISDVVSAGYHVKQWVISAQYSHVKNEITSLQPEIHRSSNTLTYRSQNLDYLNTLALTNLYSFKLTPWWEVQSNLTLQYQVAQTSSQQNNKTLNLYGVNVNASNQFHLPNDFSMEVSGFYQSKLLFRISEYLPFGSLNAGIRKKFKKGSLQLSIDDILDTNTWRIKTNLPEDNLDIYFKYNWHNRFLRLSYNYTFGNKKLRTVKMKTGAESERSRVN